MANDEEKGLAALLELPQSVAQKRKPDPLSLPIGVDTERREKGGRQSRAFRRFEVRAGKGDVADDTACVLGQPFAYYASGRAHGVEKACDVLGREGFLDDLPREGVIAGVHGSKSEGHAR